MDGSRKCGWLWLALVLPLGLIPLSNVLLADATVVLDAAPHTLPADGVAFVLIGSFVVVYGVFVACGWYLWKRGKIPVAPHDALIASLTPERVQDTPLAEPSDAGSNSDRSWR